MDTHRWFLTPGWDSNTPSTVTSFFTPIGHHGNLLIYGPGHYQFADFVRVGVPLTLIIAVIVSIMAPMLWPG